MFKSKQTFPGNSREAVPKSTATPRIQDSETSAKRERARKAYAQKLQNATQTEKTDTMSKLTKKWENKTKNVLIKTAPPEIAEQIKTSAQKTNNAVWKNATQSKQQASTVPRPALLPGKTIDSLNNTLRNTDIPKAKEVPSYRTRGMNTAKQTVKKDSDFRTRSISKQTKKPINTEIGKTLTLGNVGEFLRDNTMSGLAQFNGGLAKTADFLLPDFITPKPVEKGINHYKTSEKHWKQKAAQSNARHFGHAGTVAGNLYQGTVSAVPQAILSIMSGGQSATQTALDTLRRAGASSGVMQSVSSAMKHPAFWTSFAQTVGRDYEDAKADGANETQAQLSAITGSLLNAGIEVGSGIEAMKMKGRYGIRDWAKSALGEGLEEVEQGITSNIAKKALFDYDKPWYSEKNENAVVSPGRMVREFAGGAVAGGVLSGIGVADDYIRKYIDETARTSVNSFADQSLSPRMDANIFQPRFMDDPSIENFPEAQTDPYFYAMLEELANAQIRPQHIQEDYARQVDKVLDALQYSGQYDSPRLSGTKSNMEWDSPVHENNREHSYKVTGDVATHEKLSPEYIRHIESGVPTLVGEITSLDQNEMIREIRSVEKFFLDLPYECNYTITEGGKVFLTKGDGASVNPGDIPGGLRGSYSYHNHPDKYTNYSFSAEDAAFFVESEQAYSEASDSKYNYVMRRTPRTIKMPWDEVFHRFKEIENTDVFEMKWKGKIDPDIDSFHEVMKILSEELNFYYARHGQ